MKAFLKGLVLLSGTMMMGQALAQQPANATGQCKDNSYTTAAKKWQACSGHKGVQTWYADKAPGTPAPATGSKPGAPSTTPPLAPATAGAAGAGKSAAPAKTAQAPGGGPGLVWLNTATKTYHCPGGTFYGKTKEGKYVSEADAKKAGAHPDRNKPCS